MSIAGITLAIGLTVVVTGIALGLSAQTTIGSEEIDYWIVPEEGSASTMVVSTQGPQLGRVHPVSAQLTEHPEIRYATPVLLELLHVTTPSGSSEYVLALGVISQSGLEVGGLETASLTPGDPYYANGTYNGSWTGEVVVSTAAADLLNTSVGTHLTVQGNGQSNTSVTVIEIEEGATTGLGQVPLMLIHLSELQSLSGAVTGDQADQILVSTRSSNIEPTLAAVYPNSIVIARSGLTTTAPTEGLPLALGLTATLVGLIVGTLFIATTMGLEVTADRRTYGILGAVGFSRRSQAVLILVQTLLVTVIGGLLGVVLGGLGIVLVNHLALTYITTTPVASFHPVLVGYGVGLAVLIGFVTLPYLLWLITRSSPLEQLTR